MTFQSEIFKLKMCVLHYSTGLVNSIN